MTYEPAQFGEATVLVGPKQGAHPYANAVLVPGSAESLVIDPRTSTA